MEAAFTLNKGPAKAIFLFCFFHHEGFCELVYNVAYIMIMSFYTLTCA